MFEKILLNQDQLNQSSLRKLYYIIRTQKERNNIFDECEYYKTIYSALPDEKILEIVIEKHIKIKLFNRKYISNKKEIKEYKECYDLFNPDYRTV